MLSNGRSAEIRQKRASVLAADQQVIRVNEQPAPSSSWLLSAGSGHPRAAAAMPLEASRRSGRS
jgi:hypothetical protein